MNEGFTLPRRTIPDRIETRLSSITVFTDSDSHALVVKKSKHAIPERAKEVGSFLHRLSQRPHPNLLLPLDYTAFINGDIAELYSYTTDPTLDEASYYFDTAITQKMIDCSDILDFFISIADGLAHIHKMGYVHGDVRSPNMFVGVESDRLVGTLFDYNSVRQAPYLLKIPYREGNYETAPEAFLGNIWIDPRFDVYSLGITLAVRTCRYDYALHRWIPRILAPKGFEELIARCTAQEQDQRFKDGAELLDALITINDKH